MGAAPLPLLGRKTVDKSMLDTLAQVAPDVLDRDIALVVSRSFDRMEICEEEIADAQKRHPSKSKQLWESFGLLRPPDVLHAFSMELYRIHCRELLDHVAAGKATDTATDAELVAFMSMKSLTEPPTSDWMVAYINVFTRVFPNVYLDIGPDPEESYPGRAARSTMKSVQRRVRCVMQAKKVSGVVLEVPGRARSAPWCP